jgi:hypothetical protein
MAWSQGLGWNSRFGWEKPAATGGGGSRTTLFTWNNFSSGGGFTVSAGSVATDNQTDSDGGSTADTYTADGTSNMHNVKRTMSITASATTVFRVRAKRGTNTRFHIREDQQTGHGSVFDISAGTVAGNLNSGTGTITSLGSGWYLCETQFTAAGSTFAGIRIGLLTATSTDLNFETNTSSDTIFLYNAEVQTIP